MPGLSTQALGLHLEFSSILCWVNPLTFLGCSFTGIKGPHNVASIMIYHTQGLPQSKQSTSISSYYDSSVQSVSRVQLFATPWTATRQASLSITNTWSLRTLMSIESMMPSNHLILCCPLLFLPSIYHSIRVFSNESVLHISIIVSASASVLPMNIQD